MKPDKLKANKDREWATGMTQAQFEVEFVKRNPYSDVVPDVMEWIVRKEPEPRGIDAIPPDGFVVGE